MRIDENLRKRLKRPLGKLVSFGSLLNVLRARKGMRLIAVGDVVGKKLTDAGIEPWIWIYDGMELRARVSWPVPLPTHAAVNPKGNITDSLMAAIDDALRSRKASRVYVKGEEDLSGLYCIAAAPQGAVVVYGQPRRGVVVVPVTGEKKGWAKDKLGL